MKLKAPIGELVEAVTQASTTADTKIGSITRSLYLKAMKKDGKQALYAFALNMTSRTMAKVNSAVIEEEGEVLIPYDKFLAGLINRPPEDTVQLSTPGQDKSKLHVKYNKNHFYVPLSGDVAYIASRMKEMPFNGQVMFTVPGSSLAEFCRRGLFCIPVDDSGQSGIKKGMNLISTAEGYQAQATDGAIAVSIDVKTEKTKQSLNGIILPYQSLVSLNKLLAKRRDQDVQILMGPVNAHGHVGEVFFKFGDAFYGTQLIAGPFPNIASVIDNTQCQYTFKVNREDLRDTLQRASGFAAKERLVEIELRKDTLAIKCKGDMGASIEEFIDVTLDEGINVEEPVSINLTMDYLFNIATGSKAEYLQLGFSGPLKPMKIHDTDDDSEVSSKYVLMGVRT